MSELDKDPKIRNPITDLVIFGLTLLGSILIVVAIIVPFIVREYYKSLISNYKTIADLGSIGDFVGGTTVTFLTAASVFLLLATIFMQRKEIKISQRSIEELVKQTAASVKQAEEARKEAQITNLTMKRQQFETTFFNMIQLQNDILNSIEIEDKQRTPSIINGEIRKNLVTLKGRSAIEYFHKRLRFFLMENILMLSTGNLMKNFIYNTKII